MKKNVEFSYLKFLYFLYTLIHWAKFRNLYLFRDKFIILFLKAESSLHFINLYPKIFSIASPASIFSHLGLKVFLKNLLFLKPLLDFTFYFSDEKFHSLDLKIFSYNFLITHFNFKFQSPFFLTSFLNINFLRNNVFLSIFHRLYLKKKKN